LKWLSAMGFHIVIVRGADHRAAIHHGDNSPERISRNPGGCSTAALGTAPGPCGRYSRSAYHAPKGKVELHAAKQLTAPTAIPKTVSAGSDNVGEAAPDFGGVEGGVPGGVIGGQIGGVLGGTGTSAPTPPPAPRPVQKIVRVGSHIKPPRQTYSADPVYPPLARETHIWGTVVVDAVMMNTGMSSKRAW